MATSVGKKEGARSYNGSSDDPFAIEKIAVGPYCIFDPSQPAEPKVDRGCFARQPEKMDPKMAGSFPFSDAGWTSSTTTEAQMKTFQTSDAYAQGNWDDWMRWDSAQTQSPKPSNSQFPAPPRPMLDRRFRDSALSLQSIGTTQSPVTHTPTSIPFAFGLPSGSTPAFQFNGTVPLPSVSFDSNENPLVSPFSMDQARIGNAAEAMDDPGLHHSPESANMQTASSVSPLSSPEPRSASAGKRKLSEEQNDSDEGSKPKVQVKKTAHNMIEKRYRTNLNDKIAVLRDSVPSLRVMAKAKRTGDVEDGSEDLEGLTPAHKLNKATVLSKATEYIRHLERRNKQLTDEMAALKSRLNRYESLSMGTPMAIPSTIATPDALLDPMPHTPGGGSTSSTSPTQGMIPVPENISRLRHQATNQMHYETPSQAYMAYPNPNSRPGIPVTGQARNPVYTRLMVGSLAGLMLMEGFMQRDSSGDTPEAQGLSALPMGLFDRLAHFFFPSVAQLGLSTNGTLSTLKIFLILSSFVYLISPLLDFKPQSKKTTQCMADMRLSPAPSLASPVEVRRKAWLTAIQTVWVPRHRFLLEISALCLKTLKLSTRKLIGWNGYAFLTGTTKEQESARVKAWEIALDAQLTGGDAEISLSRLVLTLLASGTIPESPARLMLKALHVRILFWELMNAGYGAWYMFDEISSKLARRYWNAARSAHLVQQQNDGSNTMDPDAAVLPDHLVTLLELDSDDVLVDNIIQRAYNLAWNRPSAENAEADETMDSVVEDFAISSPLDALAAWWSSFVLGRVLAHSLDMANGDGTSLVTDLELAIRTAPPASSVQIRTLTAKAILISENRMIHIANALDALPKETTLANSSHSSSPQPALLYPLAENPVPLDVRMSLTLAKCLELASSPKLEAQIRAISCISGNFHQHSSFTLLSFVATFKAMEVFCSDQVLVSDAKPSLEQMATSLRIWIGHEAGSKVGIGSKARMRVVEKCLSASKSLMGVIEPEDEIDAGYVSQSEGGSTSGALPNLQEVL